MRRPADQTVSKKTTEDLLYRAAWICHYCGAPWAAVADHIRPAAQEGSRDLGNLVAACHRCNSQKSGKTPAEWKAWRLAQGMPWPPPNVADICHDFFKTIPEEHHEAVDLAYRAGDSRVWDFHDRMVRRYHKGETPDFDRDRAELLPIVAEFMAERDV
jgi:hypothetical protein